MLVFANATTSTHIRLKGRSLTTVYVLWFGVIAVTLILFVLTVPVLFDERLEQAANFFAAPLRQLHIAPTAYASGMIGLQVVYLLFALAGVALVFWQRRDDWMALLSVLVPLMISTIMNGNLSVARLYPQLTPFVIGMYSLTVILGIYVLLVFPTGQFRPRWSIGLLVIAIPLAVLDNIDRVTNTSPYFALVGPITPFFLVVALACLGVQLYRFRRVLSPLQRQQIKWINFGMVFVILRVVVFGAFDPILLRLLVSVPMTHLVVRTLFYVLAYVLPMFIFEAAVIVSLLRYHLWDIDLTINRSLGYAIVTAALGLAFLATLALVPGINSLVLVGGAVIAGLVFNPARKGVQHFVDRRFYRLRFDVDAVNAAQHPRVKNPGTLTGQKLGDYELLDFVGKGGMGEIYKGFGNNRMVAVKLLSGSPDELSYVRFERESHTLMLLNHPNIVRVYEAGKKANLCYMIMEFVEGMPLSLYLQRCSLLPLDTVRLIVADLTDALDYIHASGYIHRDLKPSNVMLKLNPDQTVAQAVLLDFGVVKSVTTQLTGAEAIGTIDYMAPEQIQSSGTVDYRADIYALGVMIYEMLTGERPFKGNAGSVLFAHLKQPAPDPRAVRPDLSPEVCVPVLRALAKQPEDRFESASELAAAMV